MQESAPDQTISKRPGRPITPDALPLSKYRHVFDIGNAIMQREYKPAEVTLDYLINMMSWLEPDENVVSCEAWTMGGSLVVTRLEYAPYAMVVWVAAGSDGVRQTVFITFTTSKGRTKLFTFAVVTEGTAPTIVTVSLTGPREVFIGYQHPDKQPEPVDLPEITVTPDTLTFPLTFVGGVAGPQVLKMENTGDLPVFLRSITVPAPFRQRNRSQEVLNPGDQVDIDITFEPEASGEFAGGITIDINDGGKQYATFTGQAEVGTRIRTSGNQFVDGGGRPVRLRSINWFGAESDIYVPHGLWARSYKEIVDQIKAMGFNCVRLPFSGDLLTEGRGVPAGVIDFDKNPELVGKTAIEVFSLIVSYLTEKEIYIVLDHHRRTAGSGADGSPVSDTYPLQTWIDNWLTMAGKFFDNPYVVGADIHNEPHELTWPVWASYAEQCGNAIHEVAPEWIIFVEGVGTFNGDSYWWGGQLAGVATRPVHLQKANRLAYAPHEYGQSVGQQSWLAYDGQALPTSWPFNLYGVWRQHWGFIFEQGIAPVWIGEFGGKFGINGAGVPGVEPHAEYEAQWLYHLANYLNGDFTGSGTTDLPDEQGISFSYWSFNPNSGDTGGIVQDDWTTPQAFKLRLLDPIMAGIPLDYLTSLNPISATEIGDSDLLLVNHQGSDFSIRVSEFMALTRNKTYEPGTVHWFATNIDPNAKYIGQTWVRVPAPEKSVRIAKTDGSDLLQQGGSDSVTIARANLPAEQLSITGRASDIDLGSKTTSPAGRHSHTSDYANGEDGYGMAETASSTPAGGTIPTTEAPDHQHEVLLGIHGHSVTGQTENLGSGQSLSVKNAYVVLAAWYRVS